MCGNNGRTARGCNRRDDCVGGVGRRTGCREPKQRGWWEAEGKDRISLLLGNTRKYLSSALRFHQVLKESERCKTRKCGGSVASSSMVRSQGVAESFPGCIFL